MLNQMFDFGTENWYIVLTFELVKNHDARKTLSYSNSPVLKNREN